MSDLLRTSEAAALAGLNRTTIARMVQRGALIPASSGSSGTRGHSFYRADIERLAEQCGGRLTGQARITKRVAVDVSSGCWNWLGKLDGRGYSRISSGRMAHRFSYELFVGPIPDGLEIDHLCRNIICVNPEHLEPVTRLENMRRRSVAYTHCKHGHEFTPENTYIRPTGGRDCRTCGRARTAAYVARRAGAA